MPVIRNPIPNVTYHPDALARNYINTGAWSAGTVGDALRKTAQKHPEKAAFICEDTSISFARLDEQTERLGAALLQLGLKPGDRALFQLGTSIETVVAVLACFKAGVIPVCTIPQYREVEISALGTRSQARAHFVQAGLGSFDLVTFAQKMAGQLKHMEHLIVAQGLPSHPGHSLQGLIESIAYQAAREQLADISLGARDVLSFQLSGGSTGLPKIIPRFHGEYQAHSAACANNYGIDENSKMIWSLPLMHNAGQLYALIPPLVTGMTSVLMPRPDVPSMLELIEKHRVTHGISIGPIAPQLIAYNDIGKHDLSSLKLFATMSRADKLEAHIGVPCSNLYGITEGLLMGSGANQREWIRHHTQGNSGCEFDEIKVLQPETEEAAQAGTLGELCFRGPSSLLAYYDDPQASTEALTSDQFFRTGDIVKEHIIEGKSYYSFEGRLRDNINRGGEKIGCEEVEGVISEHPAVADAKLVAMPDELYGEKACAYLILRPEQQAPTVAAMCEFLVQQGLAKFKCPERIEIVDEFPTTRVGKVDKVALRAHIAGLLKAEQAPATGANAP